LWAAPACADQGAFPWELLQASAQTVDSADLQVRQVLPDAAYMDVLDPDHRPAAGASVGQGEGHSDDLAEADLDCQSASGHDSRSAMVHGFPLASGARADPDVVARQKKRLPVVQLLAGQAAAKVRAEVSMAFHRFVMALMPAATVGLVVVQKVLQQVPVLQELPVRAQRVSAEQARAQQQELVLPPAPR
jgi:hypothetical protein